MSKIFTSPRGLRKLFHLSSKIFTSPRGLKKLFLPMTKIFTENFFTSAQKYLQVPVDLENFFFP
jgi:hypothetical protein